jgi:hypothetical protein
MGTNTGIGIGIGIPFKNNALGGDRPYLPPELKARLIGVWDNYGKKNTDADRNIIKNKIPNAGGDLEILNAAYKLNSGFGKYKEDFTSWRIYPNIEVTDNVITTNGNFNLTWFIYKHSSESKINEMNIKVSGIPKGGKILYLYISDETANLPIAYTIPKDGIYHLPESKINNNRVSVGFTVESRYDWNNIRIEQIPSYQGAFVTDGIDDLITSTKTVQEMLGGSNEITVVSMIHKMSSDMNWSNLIGELKGNHTFVANVAQNTDKTGIYGYTYDGSKDAVVINNILGDKKDYICRTAISLGLNNKYYVTGFENVGIIQGVSQVAWYWTIIANKVLTTDQINQVIAYFNLDKYVKPDIYYNVKKQGLTNDTPDEDWYLKDFSGNGRDMTLYNYARTPESGINEEGGLQSDGVDDYGQFVGDLGLKDYTVIIDRAYPIVSERQYTATSDATGENSNTPFLLEHIDAVKDEYAYSYLAATAISINKEREICYQSTYQYKDTVIKKGSSTSLGTGLTIAKYGVNPTYSALALYSFMLFHYSMSKFLIERQLKKRKLGTLYPGMVEFRPIVKSNIPYSSISYSVNPGEYVIEGSTVTITITLSNSSDKLVDISSNAISDISISGDNGVYEVTGKVTKSPQKINIVISSYLTMLDNETLITNETLIKNE